MHASSWSPLVDMTEVLLDGVASSSVSKYDPSSKGRVALAMHVFACESGDRN